MSLEHYWYGLFVLIAFMYLGMLFFTHEKKYIHYFITGAFFGFYMDIVSVTQGYYTYYPYHLSIFGVPLTFTIAEGCAISLTIFGYKEVIPLLLARFIGKKAFSRFAPWFF